ncbi:MAG: 2-oxoacid:ferredoxin oxidoreductase subunit beta [Candidatus Methanofastidiosia archaeon]
MVELKELSTEERPNWCPGCGDFGILNSLKRAIVSSDLKPHEVLIVSGIGCSSKLPHWIRTYGFHGIHGRTLPVAIGAKLSNHKLKVVAIAGDGDCYGIGIGHFIHSMRRNVDLTLIVHNNMVYGLTTGQTSPTSEMGFKTKSTPLGSPEIPINPLSLAIVSGATFVSRGYAKDIRHLSNLMEEAMRHRGFALVDVLQPCVTFNKINTYEFYNERVYKLEDEDYSPDDKSKALLKAEEWGERIPTGIFFKELKPTLEDYMVAISEKPLVEHEIENVNIQDAMKRFI